MVRLPHPSTRPRAPAASVRFANRVGDGDGDIEGDGDEGESGKIAGKTAAKGGEKERGEDWKDGGDVGGNWKLAGTKRRPRYSLRAERGSRKKNSSVMITGYRWRGLFLTTTLFYRYCGVAGVLMRHTIACWLLNKKYESKMAAFAAIRHREA